MSKFESWVLRGAAVFLCTAGVAFLGGFLYLGGWIM